MSKSKGIINKARTGPRFSLLPDLNQKSTPEVHPRNKLTKCPEEEEKLKPTATDK